MQQIQVWCKALNDLKIWYRMGLPLDLLLFYEPKATTINRILYFIIISLEALCDLLIPVN